MYQSSIDRSRIIKSYGLSQPTVERLALIKEKLKEDISKSDPLWEIVVGKRMEEEEEIEEEEEEEADERSKNETLDESNANDNGNLSKTVDPFPSTQFYFTQCEETIKKENKQEIVKLSDITECILEGLEHPNGKCDLTLLENLTDEEVLELVCQLEKKLSMLGIYNLCRSLSNMTLEQQIKYAEIFHTHLLLPKIIALEEPSRLLSSGITECVNKFPNDVQKLIFIPLLNVDLKDTTTINAMLNAFEPQRYITLIMEYLSHAKELKTWHLQILHKLISTKTDSTINDKIIELLSEKAFDYAKDKDFGKLVLSFVKVNANLSAKQKCLLQEIAKVHQTMFKKPIQNVLNTV